MSVKSISRAALLKNYLRMLMQQQSLILSKRLIFIILFNDLSYCFHVTFAVGASFYLAFYIIRF